MAQKKTTADSRPIDANLDRLDLGAEARPYLFAYKGKRFETIDIAEIDPDELMHAWASSNRGNLWAIARLLLGDSFKEFKALKPSIWQLKAINDAILPVFKELFGDPEGFTEPEA